MSNPKRANFDIGLVRFIGGTMAALCLLPMVAVFVASMGAGSGVLEDLIATVLGKFVGNTLALMGIVGLGTFVIGTTTAWLVAVCNFPGRRWIEVALVLPLAFPAYVLAYAYTDLLDHPGAVQSGLRALTGWGPREYWFPEVRSLGGAAIMLTFVLYPYVYLLARAAFMAQSATTFFAARALGATPFRAFFTVALPMARPAIAAGVILAMTETISDFGTVSFFSVQTFATGIYQSWFVFADQAAAAQLALSLLIFALCLVLLERLSRGRSRYEGTSDAQGISRLDLGKGQRWLATAWCLTPVLIGVVIPVIALGTMAVSSDQQLFSERYMGFLRNSLILASLGAGATLGGAIFLGYLQRLTPGPGATSAVTIARIGYALPGGVIAVGLLVPFAAFENSIDEYLRVNFGISSGLIFSGSIGLLIMAYMVRFLAAALGAYETGQEGMRRDLDGAARVLGARPLKALWRVHVPILRPSLLTGFLIVFVDVMKELPATLIMRPFNFDTLAIQAYRLAQDERLEGAAVPSLVLVAVGLLPVILICARIRRA